VPATAPAVLDEPGPVPVLVAAAPPVAPVPIVLVSVVVSDVVVLWAAFLPHAARRR